MNFLTMHKARRLRLVQCQNQRLPGGGDDVQESHVGRRCDQVGAGGYQGQAGYLALSVGYFAYTLSL